MTQLFQFEADFADSLRCIPMQVRYNLDHCGVKLKLSHWNHWTAAERQALVETPCGTAAEQQTYRALIHQFAQGHNQDLPADLPIDPQPAWTDLTTIPESVVAQAQKVDRPLTLDQWRSLTPIQRFVLIKLSRSQHENHNFLPALEEFEISPA
jgi:hypothetical protein